MWVAFIRVNLPPGISAINLTRSSFRVLVLWRWTALRDIPMRLPISPSAISRTQCRIKMLCSCSGKLAKASATSSLSIMQVITVRAKTRSCHWGSDLPWQSLSNSSCVRVVRAIVSRFRCRVMFPQIILVPHSADTALQKASKRCCLSIITGDSFHHSHPLSVGGLGGSLPFRQNDDSVVAYYPISTSIYQKT